MKNKDIFYLHFQEKIFMGNDIIQSGGDPTYYMKIISKPKRKWYSLLIQYLTLGIFKARWIYKVELIK